MRAAEVIPTHSFESGDLPEDQQFEAWTRFTAHSRVTRPGDGPFGASARFWRLEGAVVSAQTVDAFTMDRDAAFLTATAASHFLVVIPLDGQSRFTAPGIDDPCRAGDLILANLRKLGRCENLGRQRTIAISIATGFLEQATGPLEAHGRLRRSPETRLFVSFMASLVQQLPFTQLGGVAALSRILRDLLANAVISATPPEAASKQSAQGLFARARAYMDSQPVGVLDLDRMIDALGTTRSTLYRLFHDEGGVAAYDRRRRLRLLHRAVADPMDRRSLAELGYDHGFPDPAQLARQFRRAFGYSMSDLRAQLARRSEGDATQGPSAVDRYREAVGDLL
jgi:AraC-like DNA-binding protein